MYLVLLRATIGGREWGGRIWGGEEQEHERGVLNMVLRSVRDQELCESRHGRLGLPVPNTPYGLCGLKATLTLNLCHTEIRSCVKVEVAVLGPPTFTQPYGFCGRKATLNLNYQS